MRIYDVFLLRMGTLDEKELSDNFEAMISYMGDTPRRGREALSLHWKQRVCSDVSQQTCEDGHMHMELPGRRISGQRIAISGVHEGSSRSLCESALDMTLQTHTVVRDWANICRRFKSSAVLVMDSYYLSAPGRSILNDSEEKVYFIAALKRDRFKKINGFLEPKIEKSGDTAVAFNTSRGEAAVYHWSLDTNVGKKLVMSNAFTVKMGESHRKGCLPVYDHYNAGFAGCDQFNQGLHGKTLPLITKRCRAGSDVKAGYNYLFTCILLNTYHAYLSLNRLGQDVCSFNDVCASLARDLCK